MLFNIVTFSRRDVKHSDGRDVKHSDATIIVVNMPFHESAVR